MTSRHRARAVLTAAASAAVLTLAAGAPAQAAGTGWNVVFTHHYGRATNDSVYTAVAVPGAGDAWAFGTTNAKGAPAPGKPVAAHWNGTKWSSSPLPSGLTSEIIAASVVSASSVWAVTQIGGDILHWNGSQWSVADQVPGTDLLFSGITAVSDTDVWAFGESGFGPGNGTWHYDGHAWTQVTGSADGLVSASALSATDIWAIGSGVDGPPGGRLVHYTGSRWLKVAAPALSGLEFYGIQALSSTDVWALAVNPHSGKAAQLVHFDGTQWTGVATPYPGLNLDYFAPDGQGGFWLDGGTKAGQAAVVHYSSGGQWSRGSLASGGMGPMALVPGTTTLWGVGWVPTTTGGNAQIWENGQAG